MFNSLTGFLRFDPLLAAAIILALTLIVGRTVDWIRARRNREDDKIGTNQIDASVSSDS